MFAKRIREFTVVQQIYIHISIKGLGYLPHSGSFAIAPNKFMRTGYARTQDYY